MDKNIFDCRKFELDNGVKIITIKKNTDLFSVHAGIKIGSIYETNEEKGISHFIEHMVFKGTKHMDNEKLNKAFEELGGEYNAYTDYGCTVYSVTALKEEMEKSIYLISEMLKNASFHKDELDKEREVILSEIRSIKDDLEEYSFTKVNEIGFSNGPLKYDIIGTEENIKKFSSDDLINFYNKYYSSNNCFIVIVSNIQHEVVAKMVEKYFKEWDRKNIERKKVIVEDNLPIKKVSYKSEIEQSTIVYMFTFHGLSKIEEMALKILNYKLGESANSILFREIREKRGLAYDIYSDLNTAEFIKTMYIYTSVNKENVNSAVECINSNLLKIKNEKNFLDNNSIELMKKVLKTAVISTIEDTTDLGNYILHQCIDGESIYAFLEDMKSLEEISYEDIIAVAGKVLNKPTIHIMISKESD